MYSYVLSHQVGGAKCSLCGSPGTNKSTCPLNPRSKNPKPAKHPLAANMMIQTPSKITKDKAKAKAKAKAVPAKAKAKAVPAQAKAKAKAKAVPAKAKAKAVPAQAKAVPAQAKVVPGKAVLAQAEERRTLIHQAALELTGQPPTAEEVNAFLNDPDIDRRTN